MRKDYAVYREKMMEFAEACVAWLSGVPPLPFITVISVIGVAVGVMLIAKPAAAIEIQKRFYARINWRMEPISMPKELRNTRLMGAVVIVFLIVIVSFAFFSGLISG